MPAQLRQATENLMAGIDDGRVQPAYLMEKVLKQTEELAGQTPEASPFALPLKKFPAAVSAAERKRISAEMLAAIQNDVLPAYVRFAKFLRSTEIPAGRKEPGVWAIKDGDAYYAFCVRRATTLNKTPAEIHQIGLDEVKRDEAEMLAIVKKLGYADLKSFAAAMAKDPKQHPTSKDDLLSRYRALRRPDEAQAARPVRASAQSAARSGGDARISRQGSGGSLVCRWHGRRLASGTRQHQHLQPGRARSRARSRLSLTTKASPAITCRSPSRRN